jgi:hypothetical protein
MQFGQFVATVVAVVRGVISRERQMRILRSQRFVKRLAHGVQVDERGVLFACRLANGLGILSRAVGDLAGLVEIQDEV